MRSLIGICSFMILIGLIALSNALLPAIAETPCFSKPMKTTALAPKLANVATQVPTTTRPDMPTFTATWTTWTTTVTAMATGTAISTVEASPSSSLLSRLARSKPSFWGNKSFYILLSFLYLTLFGLFLKQVIHTCSRK